MRRRAFITLLGGAAAWPLTARAQQPDRARRIGVVTNLAADDPEGQARLAAFLQGLQEAGWAVGRNVRIDVRWATSDPDRNRKLAAELVALAPDAIFASTGQVVMPLRQVTRTVPIVFAALTDPVAIGLVESLARPGGNATGFISGEFGTGAKWLELLKDIAPDVSRVAVLYSADNPAGVPQFTTIQAVAPSFRVEPIGIGLRDAGEIERAIAAFARAANGGMIVTRLVEAILHRDLIIGLAAKHRLPTVYPLRLFAASGGLISYGPDIVDQHRRAAGYIDRILKGDKPADLPVQAPTKYELVINLKTAKALSFDFPPTVLARADEVIE